jgi:hypothetical protein
VTSVPQWNNFVVSSTAQGPLEEVKVYAPPVMAFKVNPAGVPLANHLPISNRGTKGNRLNALLLVKQAGRGRTGRSDKVGLCGVRSPRTGVDEDLAAIGDLAGSGPVPPRRTDRGGFRDIYVLGCEWRKGK